MRMALPLLALLPTLAAAEAPEAVPAPGIVVPQLPGSVTAAPGGRVPCRDTIHQVREERGLPPLEREDRATGEAVMIAAVDHRINGCSVMVMHGNTSDVRPLPALPEGPMRLERIPGR